MGGFRRKKTPSRLVYLTDLMEIMADKNAIQTLFLKHSRAKF
jgi:hypothetical protein